MNKWLINIILLGTSLMCCAAFGAKVEIDKNYDPLAVRKSHLTAVYDATLDPTGFESPASVAVAYDSTARTITLTQSGGVIVWWRGTRLNLGTPWVSPVHAASPGQWFLAFRTSTTAEWSQTSWAFDMVQIAFAYYTGPYKFSLRETHGLMDWHAHEESHRLIGTYRVSGGGPVAGTYVLQDGTADANITPGFSEALIQDEDNPSTVAAWPEGQYTQWHSTGTGTAVLTASAPLLYQVTGTYPNYHSWNGSTFTPVQMAANNFFNVYQVLVPVTADAQSQEYRTLIVQPQFVYTSLAGAQAEDFRSLFLGEGANMAPEFVAFTRLTFRTAASYATTGKARIEAVSYLSGSRASQVLISPITPTTLEGLGIPYHNTITVDALGNVNASGTVESCSVVASQAHVVQSLATHAALLGSHGCSEIASRTYVDQAIATAVAGISGAAFGDEVTITAATSSYPLPIDGSETSLTVASGAVVMVEYWVTAQASSTQSVKTWVVNTSYHKFNGTLGFVEGTTQPRLIFSKNAAIYDCNPDVYGRLIASSPAGVRWQTTRTVVTTVGGG